MVSLKFEYKCPVCKATNILSSTNSICRRCKSNLSSIYNIKQQGVCTVLSKLISRGVNA